MQSASQTQTYRRAFIAALVFAAIAGSVWLACGAANQHDLGEVCSPYAVGAGGQPDGGGAVGDCKSGLKCVCPAGNGMGSSTCTCGISCTYGDAGASCPSGYSCQPARDPTTQQTTNYCLPGDAGM